MSEQLGLGVDGVPLVTPAAGKSRPYRSTLAVYAERFDSSVRTLKLWVKIGKEANDLPPYDQPEEFPGWWSRHFERRLPDRLVTALARLQVAETKEEPAPRVEGAGEKQAEERRPEVGPEEATGFAATLERMRNAEAAAHRRYLDEIAKPEMDEGRVRTLQRTWSDLSNQLRQLEKAAPEVLESLGETVSKAEVEKALKELHSPIVSGTRSLLRRLRAKLGNVSLDQALAPFDAEVDRLFGELQETRFSPGR